MSFTKYPTALDDATSIPEAVDLVTPVNAEAVNRLRDAILAIEAELGADPSSTYGTVKARLDAIRSSLTQAQQDIVSINTELGVNPSGTFDTVSERFDDIDASIVSIQSDLASQVANLQAQIDSITLTLSTAAQIVSPIVSGNQNTDSTTFTAIGATALNPTSLGYPNSNFTVEVIIQTTDSNFAVDFELFNITEGVAVGHPSISTTSTTATYISVTLTVGGTDLPAGQVNVLEGRLKLATGAAASDRAICKYAAIRSIPT